MKTTGNTVLITGGSAGIGFEIARLFSGHGNKVIITGRSQERLAQAAQKLPGVIPLQSDVTSETDILALVEEIKANYPDLNVLINNAGKADVYKLVAGSDAFTKARQEMLTNYLSIIRLTELLLPVLEKQAESAIVNVSSIVAFRPSVVLPTYSASKAALHSYTQSLRAALQETGSVEVYELMPPLVNTDFSQAIGGAAGIDPAEVAQDLLQAFQAKQWEVPVGDTKQFFAA